MEVIRCISVSWWTYFNCLDQRLRLIRKASLQSLERKHLTLRTRLKRLTHPTIFFSKSIAVHETIIFLFINQFFFTDKRN
ncbi:IS1 family transposase [Spirosoma migulaei]